MSNDSKLPIETQLSDGTVWPPAPTAVRKKAAAPSPNKDGEITHCPHCRNRLLTHRSIMCSWCGKPINDEKYLEKAAAERAAVDASMREKLDRDAEKPRKVGFIAKITKTANTILQNED